jgi:DNA-binding FadR family transcriptional regulator
MESGPGAPTGFPSIVPGAPIKRLDLVALVTDSIRQQILDGVHPPGAELPAQGKLAATYNVSVNVIREALRNLRSLGMIEVSQGRCPQVKGMDPEASIAAFSIMLSHAHCSLYHLIEARIPVEREVARLAAERAAPEDMARIAHVLDEMKSARDSQALAKCDQAFHRSLATATRNPLLAAMVETLAGVQTQYTQNAYEVYAGLSQASVAEHERIFEAIRRRDPNATEEAMLHHLRAVLQRIPKNLDPTAPMPEEAFTAPPAVE